MAINDQKLYAEKSITNLLDKAKDLAEVRELYTVLKKVQDTIQGIESKINIVQKDANTIRTTINNFISNSSFLFSHRVYSMATYYNARYILSKWYGRPVATSTSWTINSDTQESPFSIRSGYGFPPLPDWSNFFPGLTPLETQYDWRFSPEITMQLDVNSSDLLNEKIKVVTEPFTPQVGTTIRVRGNTIAVPIPATISGLVSNRTYWITSVETVGTDKFITLSVTEPPPAPQAPTNIKVSGTGTVYGYNYVEPRPGLGWEVETGSLAMSGGYKAAAHLQEKKLRLGDNVFFQCQLSFAPKFMELVVDSHNNIFKVENHKLVENARVTFFSSENVLPEGLANGTVYYVTNPTLDNFQVKDADGNLIRMGSDGSGRMMARTVLNPDLTMKVSVWDNNRNRIFRGDRPVIVTSKVGSHEPRVISVSPANKAIEHFVFVYDISAKLFVTQTSWLLPPDPALFPPDKGKVKVYDVGDGLPSQLTAGVDYYIRWTGSGIGYDFYLSETPDGNKLPIDSAFDNLKIGVLYQEIEYEELVTRKYILEVITDDDRKFYSDTRTFQENVNQISNTLNPSTTDSDNVVFVSWDSIPNALGYNIYRDYDDTGFYLLGSVPNSTNQFIDYGGRTDKLLELPGQENEYNEFFTAEVRIPEITKEIFDTPNYGVKFTSILKFPPIISDFETSGEQFLQIEFLRADGSSATLADIPEYNILIDEVGLSYLAGNWSPSPRDLSIKPLPISPRIPIPRGGRGSRAEIPRSDTSLPDLNDAIIVAYWLFTGNYRPIGAMTSEELGRVFDTLMVRYSLNGQYSGIPVWGINGR